jgi:hypothetical protein
MRNIKKKMSERISFALLSDFGSISLCFFYYYFCAAQEIRDEKTNLCQVIAFCYCKTNHEARAWEKERTKNKGVIQLFF